MKKLFVLALLLMGCAFAGELADVNESKFPTTIQNNTNGNVLRASPAAAATTTAGNAVTITASPAVAGTVTAGAAAGGDVNITAGAAARLTSGDAAGGNIILTPGAGIGTGARGTVQCPGAGLNSVAIGVSAIAGNTNSIAIGTSATTASFGQNIALGFTASATAASGGSIAIGRAVTSTAIDAIAIGGGYTSGDSPSMARLNSTCNISSIHVIRKDNGELFNSTGKIPTSFAGTNSVLFTNELDTTQAAIARGANAWTITVASNVVTVNTIVAHKFSVGQYITTNADWTENAFMASLTDKLITAVTSTTFNFALTQANQAATTENNAGAGITPGDYVLTLPTGGTFFVDEIGVVASALNGTVTTHPTVQFGWSADRDGFYAPALLSRTTAVRTREVCTPIAIYAGQTSLACGMTVAATLDSATSYKIRFYFKGLFVEDE